LMGLHPQYEEELNEGESGRTHNNFEEAAFIDILDI